jgi:hypothetical protein
MNSVIFVFSVATPAQWQVSRARYFGGLVAELPLWHGSRQC